MEKTTSARAVIKNKEITGAPIMGGLTGLIGLLCGSFCAFNSFNPVGAAYIMAFAGEGVSLPAAAMTVCAGYFLKNKTVFFNDYSVCVILCIAYGLIRNCVHKTLLTAEKGLAAFLAFMLSGVIRGIIQNDIKYLLLISFIEGLAAFGLVYVFDQGFSAVRTAVYNKTVEKNDIPVLVILMGLASAGAVSLYKGVIPLNIILGFYFVMLSGRLFGTEYCAMAGIVVSGLMMVTGAVDIRTAAVLCSTGVVSGAMGKNKLFTVLSCFAVSVLTGYYFGVLKISLVLGVCASCIMFMLSSDKLKETFMLSDIAELGRNEHYAGMRKYISGRLKGYAEGLSALEKSFKPAEKQEEEVKKETSEMADKVACLVCEGCQKSESCWNSSYYSTYQTMMDLFSLCEKKGIIHTSDMPSVFRDYCIKQKEFAEAVNVTYSGHREGLIWNMRLHESRQLAKQQMGAMEEMLSSLADEIENRIYFKENLEKVIYYELRKNNDNIEKVTVEEGDNGEYEVAIYRRGCKGRQECREHTVDTVSSILGRKMKRTEKECVSGCNGVCRLVLSEKCSFRISASAAMAIKDEENMSGDSYSFMELPKGGYMMALSDGMGSGKEAGNESRTVIELLEQFAEAGFKRETALKMINSVLVMSNNSESFATLDMCYIDLYTGMAEFIKTGAAATFVIRNGKAKAIRSSSLPIGMLKYFEMDKAEYRLKKNDVIIMLTDGAAEVMDRENMSEQILTGLMAENSMKDPKDIAENVLERIKERSGFRIQDDMTVVAARVWG